MKNYIQKAGTITLTAPSGGVVSGQGVAVGDFFVVASGDAAQGEEFEGALCGAFEVTKPTGVTFSQGDRLFFDGSDLVGTDGGSDVDAGRVLVDAGSAATSVILVLNG